MTDRSRSLAFLADRLESSTGCDHDHAVTDAKALLCIGIAMGLISHAALAMWEQDARILELRGQGLACTLIGFRLRISRRTVFEAIRRHQAARRGALQQTA